MVSVGHGTRAHIAQGVAPLFRVLSAASLPFYAHAVVPTAVARRRMRKKTKPKPEFDVFVYTEPADVGGLQLAPYSSRIVPSQWHSGGIVGQPIDTSVVDQGQGRVLPSFAAVDLPVEVPISRVSRFDDPEADDDIDYGDADDSHM